MAKKSNEKDAQAGTPIHQKVYEEEFTATVNSHKESKLEEVILRGVDSPHILVLRAQGETLGFQDGKEYSVQFFALSQVDITDESDI